MQNKKILSKCMLNELFERKEYVTVLKKVSFRIQYLTLNVDLDIVPSEKGFDFFGLG